VQYIPRKDVDLMQLQRTLPTYCPTKVSAPTTASPLAGNARITPPGPTRLLTRPHRNQGVHAFYPDRVDVIEVAAETEPRRSSGSRDVAAS